MVYIRIYALQSFCSIVPRRSQRAIGEALRDAVSVALIELSDDITVSWFPIDDETTINPVMLTVDVLPVDISRMHLPISTIAHLNERLSRAIQESQHVPSGTTFCIQPITSREAYFVIGEKA